jgi:hypothetical protein
VLLPPDWRTWCDQELRAVLAHEIAHVRRCDYLTWLVARFGVALHFYHPLVHWLAGRLRLQQELAADALGARFAGGRSVYLQALSQMALRQDSRPAVGLATSFLSAPGTLMRRIQMVRDKDGSCARPLSQLGRIGMLAVLTVIVLGVSTIRSPAQKADKNADDKYAAPGDSSERLHAENYPVSAGFGLRIVVPMLGPVPVALESGFPILRQETTAEPKREPFDLSYLSPEAKGVGEVSFSRGDDIYRL